MYCERVDLRERLSETGLVYVADDDRDDELSTSELAASLDRAIAAASAEIDAALAPHVAVPLAATPSWIRQRAIDLAAEHLAERKGGAVPESLMKAAERTRRWLESVRLGTLRVPDLTYLADGLRPELRSRGLPRVTNPSRPEA